VIKALLPDLGEGISSRVAVACNGWRSKGVQGKGTAGKQRERGDTFEPSKGNSFKTNLKEPYSRQKQTPGGDQKGRKEEKIKRNPLQ